jgi:hypothetical protein
MTPSGHKAFTTRYKGRSLRLTNEVDIFPAHGPSGPFLQGNKYQALYDTGATHSAISPKVVADFQLASIGATNVGVGGGTLATTAHLINIGLPNGVMFAMLRVAQMTLHGGIDVLIGMDVIGARDFSVTHYSGNTTFSFCCPPRKDIDFVAEIQPSSSILPAHSAKVGRNDPCPCNSGKKYKKCHGR